MSLSKLDLIALVTTPLESMILDFSDCPCQSVGNTVITY